MEDHEIILYVDDAFFCLTNPPKQLESDLLTIQVKEMKADEAKPWIQKVTKKTLKLFEVKKKEPRIILGDQGHYSEIAKWLEDNGYKFQLVENRLEFPAPRFELMHGFRFNQRELVEQLLSANKSGCFSAVTRYGKTTCMINTLRAYPGVKTIVLAPGIDLIEQLTEDIAKALPDREVVQIGGGSKTKYQSEDITVCSSDSLEKCCPTTTRLILADEPHTTVTDSRYPVIKSFQNARKLAFGATLTGRFDNKDKLINGLFGEVLAKITFPEAVAIGAVCQIECLLIQVDVGKTFIPASLRRQAYKKLLLQNPEIAGSVEYILENHIPQDWQTLMFISNEAQADYLYEFLTCKPAIAMAKKLTKTKRTELKDAMSGGEIKRCLASDIYAQGVTFSDLRCVINLAGGGPYTNSIQKPGRLAEIRPNKKCGILIDYIFTYQGKLNYKNAAHALVHDSLSRLKVYCDKGYGINIASSKESVAQFFNKHL
jgi:superfamily II DNA or RNA helicase